MFGLSKKEKEAALIKKIKKQQLEMEKEKQKYEKSLAKKQEDITKMAKLILKDGKLQKVDDSVQPQPVQQAQPVQPQPVQQAYRQAVPDSLPPLPEEFIQPQQYNYQMPSAPMPPRQEYRQPVQQYVEPEMTNAEYNAMVNEAMAQREQLEQEQRMQQNQSGPNTVNIIIFMTDGQDYTFDVMEDEVEALLNNIAKAIATGSIVQIQNRIISGRHITQYMYE